jgi:putative DNA primase/helicase
MQILSKVLGEENIANVDIHNLNDNRFAKAELQNKYVNIDSDVSSSTLKNTGIIKKISGNDIISAERKFEQLFQFNNTAKLILLGNKLPKIDDDTDANFAAYYY